MKITITGSNSGLGLALNQALSGHQLTRLSRQELDLANINNVLEYELDYCDILINCAATDKGGKITFVNHHAEFISEILTVNLLSPVILSQKVLNKNPQCKIVNITSTNNNRYFANDLAYSLSKLALADFGNLLKVDVPEVRILEVRLGLTKTNFNNSRYKHQPERFYDIYQLPHLNVSAVADKIVDVLFDDTIKFLEISP